MNTHPSPRRRPRLGIWSIGLVLGSFGLVLALGLGTNWLLYGSPSLAPRSHPPPAATLHAYQPFFEVFGIAAAAAMVGGLVLGIIGIRREGTASSWIGTILCLMLLVPIAAGFTGLGLTRLGLSSSVAERGVELIGAAVPLVPLLLIAWFAWRALSRVPNGAWIGTIVAMFLLTPAVLILGGVVLHLMGVTVPDQLLMRVVPNVVFGVLVLAVAWFVWRQAHQAPPG